MRILLLFPMADGQTGPAIKHAFEKLGHTVSAVDAKLDWQRSHAASIEFKPDLIFCSRTKELTESVKIIKGYFKDSIICMWNVDTRNVINDWTHLFPLVAAVDYHFVVDYNLLNDWHKLNKKTYWLPQGLQDEVYGKPQEITEEDRRKYACDVCFCGTVGGWAHSDREQFLAAIEHAGVKLNLWGNRTAPRIYNEEHNKQVALAKINIGCQSFTTTGKAVSVRDYKIMGAGGFLLTRRVDKLDELFPLEGENRVADCFETTKDIVEKIKYWLDNAEERKEIADNGYRWVHASATYTHRMRMVLDYMKEDL